MLDSGVHLFLGGKMYYRQLDDLSISVCAAENIRDEEWTAYLEGAFAITHRLGRQPNCGVMFCLHAFPSARQRQIANDFMATRYKRPMERVVIITESAVIRGAMTAMGWLIPSLTMRAFAPREAEQGFLWLRQVATFDIKSASKAWTEGLKKLSILVTK